MSTEFVAKKEDVETVTKFIVKTQILEVPVPLDRTQCEMGSKCSLVWVVPEE